MASNSKHDSPLVASVLALQNHLDELDRVGSKINATDMTSDIDVEHIQKLLAHFAVCGQGVSEEVSKLSTHLQQARARAEAVAEGVSRQAEAFSVRRQEQSEQLDKFRLLGEKVRELNSAISQSLQPQSNGSTDPDGSDLRSNIPTLERQLTALIENLQDLRNTARASRMRALEKNAESLAQTLLAVQLKLRSLA
jgi:hypothetical protein